MRVVLVSWKIRADAVEKFKEEFPPLAPETPGLIREDLFRLEDGPKGVAQFVRIGRWESEDAFYEGLKHLGVKPNTTPPPKEYEIDPPRRREWLEWLRDDIPQPPSGEQ